MSNYEIRYANGNIATYTQEQVMDFMSHDMLNPALLIRKLGETAWVEVKDFKFDLTKSIGEQIADKHMAGNPNDTHVQSAVPTLAAKAYAGSKLGLLIVFLIAMAPLIGLFVRAFLIGYNAPEYLDAGDEFTQYMHLAFQGGDFWFVTLILNLGFLAWDFTRLKKAGVDVKVVFGRGFFLVPIYLYKRSKFFGINQVPLIVWGVMFVATQFAYH